MTKSAVMGRPKIEGLVRFPLRVLGTTLAAVEAAVEAERVRRDDPAMTTTDAVREAMAQWAKDHAPDAPKRKRAPKGGPQ